MIRLTQQRKKILQALEQHGGLMTISEIHAQVSDVDLATIYRNLDVFVQQGMIARIMKSNGEPLFEYLTQPHHHILCTDCDRVVHVDIPESVLQAIPNSASFNTSKLALTLQGRCNDHE